MRDHGPIDGLFLNDSYNASQSSAAEQLEPYHPTQQHAEHQAYFRRIPDYGVRHQYEFAHFHNRAQNIPTQGWAPGYWDGAGIGFGLGHGGWGDWNYGGDNTYDGRLTTDAPLLTENDTANNAAIYHIDSFPDESGDPPVRHVAASPGIDTSSTDSGQPSFDDWASLGFVTHLGRWGLSDGLVVSRVVPGGPAANAGLVSGDVILTVNGQQIPSAAALAAALKASNGRFEAQVWDARSNRIKTLSGQFKPNAPATAAPGDGNSAASEDP
jgi:hypothetical protein